MKLPYQTLLDPKIETYFAKSPFKGKYTLFKHRKDGFFFTRAEVRLVMHEPMNGVIGYYEGMKRTIHYVGLSRNSVFLVKGWNHLIDTERPFRTTETNADGMKWQVMKRTIDFGEDMYNQTLISFEDTIEQLREKNIPIVWHNLEGLSSEVSESTDRPRWEVLHG